jgi:ABC-type transport system substrate-binding protein
VFNALQAGDIDLTQSVAPNDIETLRGDANFQVIDRGESCNYGGLHLNHTYEPVNNLNIRRAMNYALNKQSYIDTFYAGLAVPADNWMPPATQFYKPLNLPAYDPEKAKAEIAASGLTPEQLSIDLWYPSDVARPYMPDPKGLAEAIHADLTAVGFNVGYFTAGWRTGYLRDEAVGKFEAFLLGWTCDWPGPDNFLDTAFFHCDAGKPNREFAWGPPELCEAFVNGKAAKDEATAGAAWNEAQDILARDLPTVPIVHSKPPAAAAAKVQGFLGAGNLNEPLYPVWVVQ